MDQVGAGDFSATGVRGTTSIFYAQRAKRQKYSDKPQVSLGAPFQLSGGNRAKLDKTDHKPLMTNRFAEVSLSASSVKVIASAGSVLAMIGGMISSTLLPLIVIPQSLGWSRLSATFDRRRRRKSSKEHC